MAIVTAACENWSEQADRMVAGEETAWGSNEYGMVRLFGALVAAWNPNVASGETVYVDRAFVERAWLFCSRWLGGER